MDTSKTQVVNYDRKFYMTDGKFHGENHTSRIKKNV